MKKLVSLFLSVVMLLSMIPAAAAGFADVDAGSWYAEGVDYVVSNNLMSGYSADSFGPNDTLNRAMVVQVLYNKEGKPALDGMKHNFSDVASGQWFNDAVTWGSNRNIVSGFGGGLFKPEDSVTIEQAAVILWNYSGAPAPVWNGDLDAMGVSGHSDWATNALRWCMDREIFAGVPFQFATDKATRAHIAVMLTNFLSGKYQGGSENQGSSTVAATGISLDITSHKMGEGWTQYLTATLSPAGATDSVTWISSNPKVATVDQKGKVTGVAGGEAVITAEISNGSTATCKIEVWHSHKLTDTKAVGTDGVTEIYTCACGHSYESWIPAVKVTGVDLGTGSASVEVGKSFTLTATVSPSNATFKDVTWRSSDTSVATVSNGEVTGISAGTAKIYATAGGVEAYCTVTVTSAGSSSIHSSMQMLASALRRNGIRASNGSYAIGGSVTDETSAFISYSPSDNVIYFLFSMESRSGDCLAAFEYDLSTREVGDAVFDYDSGTSADFYGFAPLNITTYTKNTTLRFSAGGSRLGTAQNDLANAGFRLAVSCWDLFLLTELDMSLEDVGFLSYE